MRNRIFGLPLIAAALVFGSACGSVRHAVVNGVPQTTYAATVPPALIPHLVTADAAARVATTPGGQNGQAPCLTFSQATRGGTTSLQMGGWGCGGYGPYTFGGQSNTPGFRPGELEAIQARNSPFISSVTNVPATDTSEGRQIVVVTDPAVQARLGQLETRAATTEQTLEVVAISQAEILTQPAP